MSSKVKMRKWEREGAIFCSDPIQNFLPKRESHWAMKFNFGEVISQ